MSIKSIAYVGALAGALLVLSSGAAAAQGVSSAGLDPASLTAGGEDGGSLGSAGEVLPSSVTGSLPGYASGPLGSAATAVCNVGSVAGSVGVGLPAAVSPVCRVLPALGHSGDLFTQGDYHGSVAELLGGVPYVGSALERVVPTDSAATAVGGSMDRLPVDSLTGSLPGS
ncbi:MAG TPA: hypothetical protein H9759_07875 [Candidatus Dietzia intestinipullorum]|nr:hypothetical protein [Candidatus Dietzia intestinipullorum]